MVIPIDRLRGLELIEKVAGGKFSSPYDPEYVNPYVFEKVMSLVSSGQGSRIVEIGAKSGQLGRLVAQAKPEVVYTGIDISPPENFLNHHVLSQSVEEAIADRLSLQLIQRADLIVFADVLEHLVNPYEILVHFRKAVGKHCKLVISLPNFFHHSNMSSIAEMRFCYEEWGVMDFTHLRFFSLRDMEEMMLAAEFRVHSRSLSYAIDQRGMEILESYNRNGSYDLREGAVTWHINSKEIAIGLASYQYVFIADPI